MSYDLSYGNLVVKKEGLDLKKFKEDLRNLCCSDFSGDSGEDYFVEFEKNGETVKMSSFDCSWEELTSEDRSLPDIAREILLSNFESDREYFVDYNLSVLDREEEIIIFTAALTYC